jgi:PPOX class probable F420-dependent enzyme
MGVITPELRRFLDANRVGVLATTAASGKPRQSLVYYVRDGDRLFVSTLADRLKAQDVRRTGWASLCVMAHALPYPSATFSGHADVLTHDLGVPTARIAQRISGEDEPPDPLTDEALAAVGRVLIAISVERVSAVSYVETEASPA